MSEDNTGTFYVNAEHSGGDGNFSTPFTTLADAEFAIATAGDASAAIVCDHRNNAESGRLTISTAKYIDAPRARSRHGLTVLRRGTLIELDRVYEENITLEGALILNPHSTFKANFVFGNLSLSDDELEHTGNRLRIAIGAFFGHFEIPDTFKGRIWADVTLVEGGTVTLPRGLTVMGPGIYDHLGRPAVTYR